MEHANNGQINAWIHLLVLTKKKPSSYFVLILSIKLFAAAWSNTCFVFGFFCNCYLFHRINFTMPSLKSEETKVIKIPKFAQISIHAAQNEMGFDDVP